MSDFNPEWTVEQAVEADNAVHDRADYEVRTSPLAKWTASQKIAELCDQLKAGDERAVLHGVFLCAFHDLIMPDWLSIEFCRRYRKVLHCKVISWDEAFGQAFPPYTNLHARREWRVLPIKILHSIDEIRRKKDAPIDQDLFERVGGIFGISGSKARDMYYEAKRRYRFSG